MPDDTPTVERFYADGVAMVQLLGPQDRLLRVVEREHPGVDVHVRGNEITLTGDAAAVAAAKTLVDELLAMTKAGHDLGARRCVVVEPHPADRGRSAALRGARRGDPLVARQDHPAQDARSEGVRRRDRREHDRVRHRARRHRQDLSRDGEGRAGASAQRGQPHHPDASGRRGGGAPRLPARNAERQDRPVPATALRRAQRDDGPGARAQAHGIRHDRGRTARLHARAAP